jgi:C-terminal processing protease CtpA/Prc
MKEEKRATIVGEKSIGGAHPAIGVSLPYKTILQVPVCVLWSYSTHKDFEGIGVIPDIEIKEKDKVSEVVKMINSK